MFTPHMDRGLKGQSPLPGPWVRLTPVEVAYMESVCARRRWEGTNVFKTGVELLLELREDATLLVR